MALKREEGGIQPGINWWRFTTRIPGIHVKLNWPMTIQGALIHIGFAAVGTGVLMNFFDMPFNVAWAMVPLYMFWIMSGTVIFGEPYFPGWITPALPLVMMHLGGYAKGTEAIQAMTALGLTLGLVFLIFAITGIGDKVFSWVPQELRAAIIMGAAIAAFMGEFKRLGTMPITLSFVYALAILLLFSVWFNKLQLKNKFLNFIVNMSIILGFLIGAIVGPIAGEITFNIQSWGIYIPAYSEFFRAVLPYYVGWPTLDMFIASVPVAFVIYVIVFGDLVLANTLLRDADEARQDEKISIDMTRSHYALAFRNIFQVLTSGPFIPLHGPIFTGGTVFLSKRYIESRKNLDSIFEGTVGMNWLGLLLIFIGPLVFFFSPLVNVGLALTMALTGLACAQIAMRMIQTTAGMSYVLLTGAIIAHYGPTWGLLAGIALYFWMLYEGPQKVGIMGKGDSFASYYK